jgi:TRAP-type mannitol/chloroaromatic compound transport system permease small subunit
MSDLPSGAAPISDLPPVDRLARAIGDRLAWLFLISAALTCYEVMMDAVFDAPTIWVHDATIMLGAICFLFGGAYALQRRDHIRITFLYDALPLSLQRACDLTGLLCGLVYLTGLGWFAGAQAFDSIMRVERSGRAWDFPMPMVIRIAFFLGTALLALQTASLLIQLIRKRANPWQ